MCKGILHALFKYSTINTHIYEYYTVYIINSMFSISGYYMYSCCTLLLKEEEKESDK